MQRRAQLASDPAKRNTSASANPLEALPYLLDQSIALWNARLAARLRSIGLTFEQWRVLLVTIKRGPMNIRMLSDATLVPHSTLGRWLTKMEEDGLVRRRPLSEDNRSVEILITRKGRSVYDAALPLAIAEYDAAVRNFTAGEVKLFLRFVRRLRENVTMEAAKLRRSGSLVNNRVGG